jgi:hypothetical protein
MVLLNVRPSLAAPQVALPTRCGNYAVDISLGGFLIRILVESSELRDAILDQFSSYTTPAWSTPDLELRVQPTNEPHFLPLNEGTVQIKWNLIPGGSSVHLQL